MIYPAHLFNGFNEEDHRRLRMLYKTFTANIEDPSHQQIVPFVRDILKSLYQLYPIKFNPRKNEMDTTQISKHFSSICTKLEKEHATAAKALMLEGKIKPKDVAENDFSLYFNAEVEKEREKAQTMQLLESQTQSFKFKSDVPKGKGEASQGLCWLAYQQHCGLGLRHHAAKRN